MKKDRSCTRLIREIYYEWSRCSARFQSAYGISQTQLVYLSHLYEAGEQGLYLKELEKKLQIGQTSVVRMIDKLESMGIVKKYRMIGTLEKRKPVLPAPEESVMKKLPVRGRLWNISSCRH